MLISKAKARALSPSAGLYAATIWRSALPQNMVKPPSSRISAGAIKSMRPEVTISGTGVFSLFTFTVAVLIEFVAEDFVSSGVNRSIVILAVVFDSETVAVQIIVDGF